MVGKFLLGIFFMKFLRLLRCRENQSQHAKEESQTLIHCTSCGQELYLLYWPEHFTGWSIALFPYTTKLEVVMYLTKFFM